MYLQKYKQQIEHVGLKYCIYKGLLMRRIRTFLAEQCYSQWFYACMMDTINPNQVNLWVNCCIAKNTEPRAPKMGKLLQNRSRNWSRL